MDPTERPLRSVLYIPGGRERALQKARGLAADAIIFDLEDAVGPQEKTQARALLAEALRGDGYGPRMKILRVNGLDSPWGAEDLEMARGLAPDAVLIPKVSSPADVEAVAKALPGQPLWAMMETPRGILNAAAIADHSQLTGLVLGTNDLAKEVGCRGATARAALSASLQLCLLAARAAGRVCLDGVYNAFRDAEGFAEECAEGRALGFDGKTLIHPDQIAGANAAFAPAAAELDLAARQIAAYEAALAAGTGVAVVDGSLVENLHVATARSLIARAAMITELERSLTP